MKPTFKTGDYVGFNSAAVDAVVVEVLEDDPVEYKVELLYGDWRRQTDAYHDPAEALLNELSRTYAGGSYQPNNQDQDSESVDADSELPSDIDWDGRNYATLPEISTQGEDLRSGNSTYLCASAKANIAVYEAAQT